LYEASSTASGGSPGAPLLVDREAKWPVSWSADGRYVLYVVSSRGANHILALPLFGDRKAFAFGHGEDSENWAAFSPDGKWVAYSSTEEGDANVYLAEFPSTPSGRAWRVSAHGGTQARWRRDGKELYYLSLDRQITAVTIGAREAGLDIGAERALFEITYPYGQYHAFDVTADGQRFLVNALVTTSRVPVAAN
jgi:Tol biopolymer transport system component